MPPLPDESGQLIALSADLDHPYRLVTGPRDIGLVPFRIADRPTLDICDWIQHEKDALILTWTQDQLPPGPAGNYPSLAADGVLFDDFHEDGQEMYMWTGGQLRLIPDYETLTALYQPQTPPPSLDIVDGELSTYLLGRPFPSWRDWNVYTTDDRTFWVMLGGKLRRVSTESARVGLGITPHDADGLRRARLIATDDLALLSTTPGEPISFDVKHVVVLMFENRSFDHIFGFEARDPFWAGRLRGLTGMLDNYQNHDEQGNPVQVSASGDYVTYPDPPHELADVAWQLSGQAPTPGEPFPRTKSLNGFIAAYRQAMSNANEQGDERAVMYCQPPKNVPIFTALAREYAVCDMWFSSVPGPTFPNRMFAHAGTCAGYAKSPLQGTLSTDALGQMLVDMIPTAAAVATWAASGQFVDQLSDPLGALDAIINSLGQDEELGWMLNEVEDSIYEVLNGSGLLWAIYMHDATEAAAIKWLRSSYMEAWRVLLGDENVPLPSRLMNDAMQYPVQEVVRPRFRGFRSFVNDARNAPPPGFPQAQVLALPHYAFVTPRYLPTPDIDAVNTALFKMIQAARAEEAGESAWDEGENEDWGQTAVKAHGAELVLALTARFKENDAHPGERPGGAPKGDIRSAQRLLLQIYNALRDSPEWEKTVLIVLFDEHGGFYDHVPPPDALNLKEESYDATIPGFRGEDDPTFDFTELGLRVPAIVISPWIEAATVDHTVYDHTSLLDAALRLLGVDIGPRKYCRTQYPATFADLLSLGAPRRDCLTSKEMTAIYQNAFPGYEESV